MSDTKPLLPDWADMLLRMQIMALVPLALSTIKNPQHAEEFKPTFLALADAIYLTYGKIPPAPG